MAAVEVLDGLGSDGALGLTTAEVERRQASHGPNQIDPEPPVPALVRLLAQFANPVVYLLLAAIAISAAVWVVDGTEGIPFDVIAISVIIVINAMVGFAHEARADQAVAALRQLTGPEAVAIRDGRPGPVPAVGLVPGDVILLSEGSVVPADARLLDVGGLQVSEAALTGESAPVVKTVEPVANGAQIGDRVNMVHSATAVVRGRGRAVVTTTGTDTEVGRIATLLHETESEQTPLQREIDRVGVVLGIAVVVIATVVVATLIALDGLRSTSELLAALLIGVSLAVAAVPEGLPAVLSLVLALGVQRMAGRNALVKRLVAVEALGSATIICSDKTGTLTRNEMLVRRIVVPAGDVDLGGSGYGSGGELTVAGRPIDHTTDRELSAGIRAILLAGGLASDAELVEREGRVEAVGDPTEAAILAATPKAGLGPDDLDGGRQRLAELPFTAERKRMSVLVAEPAAEAGNGQRRSRLVVKGAPEEVLGRCRFERIGDGQHDGPADPEIRMLTPDRRRRWAEVVERLAGEGLRTLAVADRAMEASGTGLDPDNTTKPTELDEDCEHDLTLLGIIGIIDPPRAEAKAAIDAATMAGLRVAMITGDHPRTAAAIATELGILTSGGEVVTGAQIEAIDDDELAELAATTTVYARVAPEHKLRIVNALTTNGEVVAMTGDGVNDAPALRAANIGIAMGLTGTDVSKEAADTILTDDNFATIVAAVHEGRAIYHNIRSFLRYLLSSNVGEVLTVFLGVVLASAIGLHGVDGVVAPLLAVQILWINLVTDAAPALALGVDPAQPGLMARPPRGIDERVIDRPMQIGIVLIGATMAVATLAMLDLRLPGGLVDGTGDEASARTSAFTVLVLAQLFNTFNARSDRESMGRGWAANPWLLAAIALSFSLQVAVVHVPFMNEAFGTEPMSLSEWGLAAAFATSVLVVAEVRKLVVRRGPGPTGSLGPGPVVSPG